MTTTDERFPRIKKGTMIMATKDGKPGKDTDRLFVNSYLGRHVQEKPDYWPKLEKMLYGKGRVKKYAQAVEDIVEKYSFMMLARDQISFHESTLHPDKRFHVKYNSYTFVFMTKAFLDSFAVFINEIYQLGFQGGQIDLNKDAFLKSIRREDPELGMAIDKKRKWIDYVIGYRNTLIHKHGLYIGVLPTIPEDMHDPVEQTQYILEEQHYMPVYPTETEEMLIEREEGEFIKVTALVDEWLNEAFHFFNIGLRFFALKFEMESEIKSKGSE